MMLKYGYNSFNNCYKLTKVVIPNKVREIEYRAYGCNFNPYNHGTLDTLILGKSLTTIGSNAFVGQNMINYIKSSSAGSRRRRRLDLNRTQ